MIIELKRHVEIQDSWIIITLLLFLISFYLWSNRITMDLPYGKISPNLLSKIVFKSLGSKRQDVVLGPKKGEDAAIVKIGSHLVAVSCDPISGAVSRIGWLAVHVVSSMLPRQVHALFGFYHVFYFQKGRARKLLKIYVHKCTELLKH